VSLGPEPVGKPRVRREGLMVPVQAKSEPRQSNECIDTFESQITIFRK